MSSVGDVLLAVSDLKKHFPIQRGFLRKTVGYIRAVDGVDFVIHAGETVALVGESGCGKTTVAKMILRALDPTSGSIQLYEGDRCVEIASLGGRELKHARRYMQMIFQDPYSSLNPRQRIRDIIGEPLLINGVARGRDLDERVRRLMEDVGLRPEYGVRYPHAFSGGQRQRVGIARALALNPSLVVCDEPVSALDMSIQAQILNLLKDLQKERDLTYLFISHDLGVVEHVSDRVAVMYLGRLVETAPTRQLIRQPRHPYTEALLAASPKPHPRYRGQMKAIAGELPDASRPVEGCRFRSRCPYAQEICRKEDPPLRAVADGSGRQVACHFADELELVGV